MLVKYQSNLESVNFEILYNLILNILIALTESNNYAYQFKNILKLDKFGFDLAEIKYLNDQFENYIEYPEDEEVRSIISNLK